MLVSDHKHLREGAQGHFHLLCSRCPHPHPAPASKTLLPAVTQPPARMRPAPARSRQWITRLVPAAVHDLVDCVPRQLGPVEPVALGDLHDHLRVVVQVIGLLPQAEHFPHQDPCTMGRAAADRGERASVKRYSLSNELHTLGQEGSGSEPGSLGDESKHGGRGREGGPGP